MIQTLFNRLLAITVVMFTLLWLFLHFFNQFAADDFQLIYERFHYGIVDATLNQYNTYCGRWAPLAFIYTMLTFSKISIYLFMYGLFTMGFAVLASYRFFRVMANNYIPNTLSWNYVLAISVFFLFSFFMLTPEKSEVWFWHNATSMYFWNLMVFLFGTSFLLSEANGKTEYILIALSFGYVGAASEPFALVTVWGLTCIIIYKAFSKKIFPLRYLFALIATLAAFIINMVAEGNEVRASQLPPASGRVAVHNMVSAVYHLLYHHGIQFLSFALLFFACWMFIGLQIGKTSKPFNRFNPLNLLLGFFIIKLLWIGILFPAAYTLGGIPPQRVQGALYFTAALFFCGAGLYTGISLGKSKLLEYGGVAAMACLLAITGIIFYKHLSIEPAYAKAFKERQSLLTMYKEEGRETVLVVKQLPDPGYLYSADITPDTTHMYNMQLKTGMGLSFNVAREK